MTRARAGVRRAPLDDVSRVRIDVRLTAGERLAELRAGAIAGLLSEPKELEPRWLYDERGSALFEAITRLPEYYLTRREREILAARADEIAALVHADTLVELGAGSSAKTRLLLDALTRTGRLRRFAPLDASERALRETAAAIAAEYTDVEVHGVVGDFERHVGLLPRDGRRLVLFLGSTIGNLRPEERRSFLRKVRDTLTPDDALLLGTDLVKGRERLLAAYDDAAGVTAAFNRNVLWVLNRELGATFVPHRFAHVVRYDDEREWVEMLLRAERPHRVRITAGVDVAFRDGEEIRTEISAKFRRARLEEELRAGGFRLARWWTDRDGDFAVSLSVPD